MCMCKMIQCLTEILLTQNNTCSLGGWRELCRKETSPHTWINHKGGQNTDFSTIQRVVKTQLHGTDSLLPTWENLRLLMHASEANKVLMCSFMIHLVKGLLSLMTRPLLWWTCAPGGMKSRRMGVGWPELRSCVNREVDLGSHSQSPPSPTPNKPYGFCGHKASWNRWVAV